MLETCKANWEIDTDPGDHEANHAATGEQHRSADNDLEHELTPDTRLARPSFPKSFGREFHKQFMMARPSRGCPVRC